ncbi:MAG: ABC transporter permease [Bacteroidales bacterium]|nr:ABC transporter permease [Bacteroidales bacterium]
MEKIKNFLIEFGKYILLMREAFRKPQNWDIFRRKIVFEMKALGLDSIVIVLAISIFIGSAVVMQMLYNLDNPIYPDWVFGFASRKTIILEFSPTVISLILAGKCASRIASELGTQRITEQIDALEIMGVNTASYLIMPKIIACLFFFPVLIILSIVTALIGGAFGAMMVGTLSLFDYVEGLRLEFNVADVVYALIKTAVNAWIISSVASFRGYTMKGGSVEVGHQSTNAVVQSSIVIMIFNMIITKLFV